ncbi:hypothetical protein E5C26_20150 [Serratia proteamaculans]|uniref:phosphopantetheine-binding protein n=1 Tax=Serratia proteamaculans TaxID=28151 RepID=UPI001075D32C|nr:phosphopantetheine-binding protein [Serratia proteamaculans]TFZ49380.1 hypothetical protein E5C26_20150 [Serratia proteamaculans]
MSNNLEQHVKTVISSCLVGREHALDNEALLVDQLFIDSLELVDIIISLNDVFGIEISGDEIIGLNTVGDLCLAVERQLAANGVI